MKSYMLRLYDRLLADICIKTEVPLGAPGNEISDDWVLKEGPKLDKQLLQFTENRGPYPDFPDWILPLTEELRGHLTDPDLLGSVEQYPCGEACPRGRAALLLGAVRQLLVFCYKAEFEPTNEQIECSVKEFEETDRMAGIWASSSYAASTDTHVMQAARRIVGRVIGRIDWSRITPSHGPGGVFPPCKPWRKSEPTTYYPAIAHHYPYDQYFCGLPNYWEDVFVKNDGLMVTKTDIVANLVPVPKDSRGPRLICVHPKEAIWIQQGQRRVLEQAIERSPLTKGRINFTDQTVNQRLALQSSKTREFVTLDLKEASDRISCHLVKLLFGDYAYDIMSCTRASKTRLPNGRVIELQKWAAMGNALCFPVQSLTFFALVQAAIISHYGVARGHCGLLGATEVYVFGDDIVFPVEYYDAVIRGLCMFGLVPNHSKTFVKGFFRESCGVDAFAGKDITPLRVKARDLTSLSGVVSFLSLAKRLRMRGYDTCASYIYATIRQRLGRLPLSNNPYSSGLVEYVDVDLASLLLREPSLIFREDIHQWVTPCRLVRNAIYGGPTGYWYNLQDSLIRLTLSEDLSYGERGTEYPIPYRVQLSYGWTPAL